MKKLNICLVSLTFPPDIQDGAGQVFREYYDRLLNKGHNLTVITGLWKNEINDSNIIQLKVSNRKIVGFFQFVYKVRKYLKKHKLEFDIIHCNNPKSALPIVLLKNPESICTVHDLRCFETKRKGFLEKKVVRFVSKRSTKILTDSKTVKNQFKTFLPDIKQEKIEVLYLGINERFKNLKLEGRALKNRLGCREKVLLYVGRITNYKGLGHIIHAFGLLTCDFTDLTLVVGGLPDFKMKKQYKLWNDVFSDLPIKFVGFIPEEELPVYYSMADLFITYSDRGEGFGLTPVEALSCETPVVCSNLPVFKEILGTLALYVPIKSTKKLYSHIKWFFSSQIAKDYVDVLIPLSKIILKKYQWDDIILEIEKKYNSIINK